MLFAYRLFPISLEFPSRNTFSRTLELVVLLMDALKSNQCIPRTTYNSVVWHSVAKETQNKQVDSFFYKSTHKIWIETAFQLIVTHKAHAVVTFIYRATHTFTLPTFHPRQPDTGVPLINILHNYFTTTDPSWNNPLHFPATHLHSYSRRLPPPPPLFREFQHNMFPRRPSITSRKVTTPELVQTFWKSKR